MQKSPTKARWTDKLQDIWFFIRERFDLHEGKEEEAETIDYIRKNVEFRGANLWILIFAILVASVGLNVNSTAVIIGAMLISPLMGPIMGIGLAAGINDFELVKKSFKNLSIAVLISILTSTLYFSFTPLDDAQSELLARTEPTIWDVLIAFFGGLAGIVAGSRKEKSNAIPGVAIATALMPPLCTAGFGLATGNMYYFFGAFYLFFINSVFISISTYLIVRFMHFPKKEFLDPRREKQVRQYITFFALATIIPSVYLAYNIVTRTFWEKGANTFIATEFDFERTQVINTKLFYAADSSHIEVVLIGDKLTEDQLSAIKKKTETFGLKNTYVSIKQSGDPAADMNVLRSDILKDLYDRNMATLEDKDKKIALLERELEGYVATAGQAPLFLREARVHHKDLQRFTLNQVLLANAEGKVDTLLMAYAGFQKRPSQAELARFQEWLKVRTQADTVALIVQ
ncbi:MAG: TIGR00341 family protein [Nitritalea sp.]